MAGLRAAELDILVGALRTPRLGGDVRERPLFSDPHLVAVRRGHPLANGQAVHKADLARFPWVVPPLGTPRRAYVDNLFAELPARPRIVAETSSLAMMTALLGESDCLTLVSRGQALEEFQGIGLATLPLNLHAPERTVGATTRTGWLPTIVQRRFLHLLRQECRRLADEPRAAA
jgi:DNA-binding transcriptional LysR family regulator